MSKILVVGAGVIGLTTALRLRAVGHAVTIWASQLPPHTTSDQAAAVWYPFLVEPRDRVRYWSQASLRAYEQLAQEPHTGVSDLDITIFTPKPLWWADELPLERSRRLSPRELPMDRRFGYRVSVPLVETQIFMPYLLWCCQLNGVVIEEHTVHAWADIEGRFDAVVNCAGLGARQLTGDTELHAVTGHILPIQLDRSVASFMDETVDELNTVSYLFQRSDLCILGGSEGIDECDDVRPEIVARIRERGQKHCPELLHGIEREPYTGLRPGRSSVRLDVERKDHISIIHNYGHGGAGFTLAWGCADECVALFDQVS